MKKNVVADTSFFICNACNLKRYDLLLQYLDLYQFNAGNIITTHELPNMGSYNKEIRSKIRLMNPQSLDYYEFFKSISLRKPDHIEHDGEYEAIGIAIELSLKEGLHCLILDDKCPKNFVLHKLVKDYPELKEKTHGTVGFIANSYRIDKLIPKSQCICHLRAIYQAWIESPKTGRSKRPCAMDEGAINKYLLPLIKDLENSNE